ncbi:MAG: nickel-type superoxide dismutase maturation protease [Myxococcota bacterium]
MFGWRLVRVVGESMAPALEDGDFVLVGPNATLSPGHVVLVRHPRFGVIVKRLHAQASDGRYAIAGDNAASTASQSLGPIEPSAILGVARWRISRTGVARLA